MADMNTDGLTGCQTDIYKQPLPARQGGGGGAESAFRPDADQPQAAGETTPKKKSRALPIIFECLFYAALAAVVAIVYASAGDGANGPRAILGYTASTVLTGSMQSELPKGSFIVTKQVEPQTLKVGDNITFLKQDHTTITHKIIGIYENYDQSGMRAFVTQGVENGLADDDVVWADNVVGKVVWHNLFLGQAISYIKTNILFVSVMTVLVIGFFVALRSFISACRKKSAEQQSAKDA